MRMALPAFLAIALFATMPAFAADAPAPSYRIVKTVPLGPGERWDYVTFDPVQRRVYVAHGDHVTVVDEAKGTVVGQIGTFPGGTHGIAISPKTHQGFTDDGKAGVAVAFDLASLKPGTHIPTAPDADGIIVEPVTGHLYVVNGDSGSLTVIDPMTDAAIATIEVGAGLEAGVADGKGTVFVDGAAAHDIVRIDAESNTVVAHFPMPDCQRPHGIAVDPETRRVFATCANNVMVVVDAESGANLATLPIGAGSDGAAFDAKRKLVFSSNGGDGTLSVIAETGASGFAVAATIKTMPTARTIAIDPKTGRLFLVAAEIARTDPPAAPGGRPHVVFTPNSLKLIYLDPAE
jgi:YVTN family beta-propeller protein